MAKASEQDYFAASTMTFGEHLDELRGSLVKALLALGIGAMLGLWVANYVVQFIQTPLERALAKYELNRDLDRIRDQYGPEAAEQMEGFVKKNAFIRRQGLSFNYIYVEASEIRRLQDRLQASEVVPVRSRSAERPVANAPEVNAATATTPDGEPQRTFTPPLETPDFLLARIWLPTKARVTALSAQEAFMIWLKAGFVTGVILSSPVMFYYIWTFVAAGLYPHEQRYVYVYLPFSLTLFLAGSAMAFFMVFDPVLDFLFSFNRGMNIDPDPRISEWISFVLFLPLGFGIAFQLPLVMLFINRLGIIDISTFTEKWRIAVLGIFVISMVLTPADPVSMLLMAVPLTVLYFLGILLCLWMPRSRSPFDEQSALPAG